MNTSIISPQSKKEFWTEQIENWKNSNLSQVDYCKRNNLKIATFQYWRSKFNQSDHSQSLLPVTITSSAPPISQENSSGVSLQIGEKIKVELETQFDSDTLSALLDILVER